MTAASLDGLLRARSVALVGATERSHWSNSTFANFAALGFRGAIYPVNPKGGTVYGLAAATSCAAIGEPVDAAILMVAVDAFPAAFADMNAAGIRNAVILTSGFAEIGAEGAARQAELRRLARGQGITMLGPNCLGFINYVDRVPIWTIALPNDRAGSVAVVSQSGATAAYIAAFAGRQGIGVSYVVSTGNEADISVARVVDFLVDDPATRVITLFLETSHDAELLAAAAQRALAAGKPIIALKIGASEIAARSAQAHSGSLVGDDGIFSAACQRHGIIRVPSIDDLVATAGVLATLAPVRRGKLAALSISGGVCEIAGDRCAAEGVALAELAPQTLADLRGVLPAFATPGNPLDVTGGAMLKPELFTEAMAILGRDPDVGVLACLFDMRDGAEDSFANRVAEHIGKGFAAAAVPGVMISAAPRIMTAENRAVAAQHGLPYLPAGVHHGMAAIGHALRWQARRERARAGHLVAAYSGEASAARPQGERAVLDYLEQAGIPVIPALQVDSAAAAAAAARTLGGEVAMKIVSPDIAHKSDIGGVRLRIRGGDAAAAAFTAILADVRRHRPDARITGVVVAPMREAGLELFVGTLRDPHWGPAIAVGLGGVWVEALQDTSLRLLPVDAEAVLEMLAELRGARLLDGYRGMPAIDRMALAHVIARIGDAALDLGPDLLSLEINPLLVDGDRIEALDGLVVWAEGTPGSTRHG